MLQLALPKYDFKLKKNEDKYSIFDAWRKRYVALTPEEWVRQHFLHYLVAHKGFPVGLIAVEKTVKINGMNKRCDALVYNAHAEPIVLLEFKAPHVPLTQAVTDQVAIYNTALRVQYFIVSNGMEHGMYQVDLEQKQYLPMADIPHFSFFEPAQ